MNGEAVTIIYKLQVGEKEFCGLLVLSTIISFKGKNEVKFTFGLLHSMVTINYGEVYLFIQSCLQ